MKLNSSFDTTLQVKMRSSEVHIFLMFTEVIAFRWPHFDLTYDLNLDPNDFFTFNFLNLSHRIYPFTIFSQLIFVMDLGAWTENSTAYHSLGSLNAPFLSQFRASLIWLRFCNSEIAAWFWLADRVLCEVTLAKFKCFKWPRDQSVLQF